MSKAWISHQGSSGSIVLLTPDYQQSTCHVSPSSASQRPLTLLLQTLAGVHGGTALQHAATAGKGGDDTHTHTHSFMLFPSFEIVIKADLIKPVCIIEVLRETLTGSRYSAVPCKRLTRSGREFWDTRGRPDMRLLRRTLTRRRLPVCPDAA